MSIKVFYCEEEKQFATEQEGSWMLRDGHKIYPRECSACGCNLDNYATTHPDGETVIAANEQLKAALRLRNEAIAKICENEADGYGCCRYCGAEDWPYKNGERMEVVDGNVENAEEFVIDSHKDWCPSQILSNVDYSEALLHPTGSQEQDEQKGEK